MKFAILAVLAFCLILTDAGVVDPLDFSVRTVEDYTASLAQRADEVSKEVEAKYDELITQPLERVDESINAIEARKDEDEQCVEQQKDDVENIVKNLENSLDFCSQTAATSSSSVAVEIVKLTTELVYDTIKLAKGIQRCKNYKNGFLKSTCYAAQTIRALLLVEKTKHAVEDINKSVDETLPQVLQEFEQCSVNAEKFANEQLENVNRAIDNCIAAEH